MITYEEFKKALPKEKRKLLTEDTFEIIKRLDDDPDLDLRNELISYTQVLAEGKYKLTDYAKACKYIAYKSMGLSNIDAFNKVFPERIKRWEENDKEPEKIHRYIHRYNKSPLVLNITKKTLLPIHLLNQDLVQRAINVQADLMMNAKSELVRQKAAETLIKELKLPEDNKIELDITMKKDKSLEQLEQTLAEFSAKQLEAIQNKQVNTKQIAEMDIITVEPE